MIRDVLRFTIPVALLLVVGCRGLAPVHNVTSAPVTANRAVSSEDVQKAIIRAGARFGWQMIAKGPGSIEGTLVAREHRAVIDIKYNPKTYTITYKDSEKLQYDGTNIHPNYNGWIIRLDNQIRVELAGL